MHCQICDHPNPPGARFCMNCGAPTTVSHAATPVRDLKERTPDHLAQKIIAGRRQIQGERRTVTVLFADLAGSTAMEEKLDPEHAYRIMQDAVARMSDCVQHCEGTVTQFRGDGIMALFGAPIAHENSAHRAVAAALAMQRRLEDFSADVRKEYGVQPHFRVGLNTGPVVVGSISDDLSMDYTPMGDTVNVAARMEAAAQPGTVLISENTYEAVKHYVECEALGTVEAKGKSQPVPVYRALRDKGTRARLDVAAERGLTPFIGREAELARLRGLIPRLRAGEGGVLVLSGDAGVGKSRLLLEWRRSIPDEVTWLEAGCRPYGSSAGEPLVEIARGTLGVGDADDETAILQRVDQATARWSEASRATVPYLKFLLGVPPGDAKVGAVVPAERGTRIREALIALLTEEGARRPLVIVIEDLHWIDEHTNNMLLGLLSTEAAVPVLMVLTHRPGIERGIGRKVNVLAAGSVSEGPTLGAVPPYQRINLSPLSQDDSTSLAEGMLGGGLPDDLRNLITSKAEGNPFFIEEVARSLVESGVLERREGNCVLCRPVDLVRIPHSVEEVVLARIDSLEPEPRATVQLASVIGREFTHPLLESVADPQMRLDSALSELEDLDFIYETAYVPELSYAFKHAITSEVAHSTLLQERRKFLHALVAASMEELYADRLPQHFERLAHHYLEAQAWDKALDYLEKAGDKAFGVFANEPAVDFYTKALSICDRLGDGELRRVASLLQKRSDAHFMLRHYQETVDDNLRWRDVAVKLGDLAMEGLVLVNLGGNEAWHETFEGALTTLERALAFADKHNLEVVRLRALSALTLVYYDCFRMDDARRAIGAAVELADRIQPAGSDAMTQTAQGVTMVPPGALRAMRFQLGMSGASVLAWTGRFEEALALAERYEEAAASLPNIFARLNYAFTKALALGGNGEYDRALTLLHEVVSTCERLGEHFFYARILNTLGWIYAELQDFDRAIYWNQRSLQSARGWNPPAPDVEGNALDNLADNYIALGRLHEAEECLNAVAKMVDEKVPKDCMQQWRYALHQYASFAELWLARGEYDRAIDAADECLGLAGKTESAKYIVRARRCRGEALLAQSKLDEAEQEIGPALSLAIEVGNPPQLWRTQAALGALRRAQGRLDEAQEAYACAARVIDGVAAGLSDVPLRDTFLQSEHVKAIKKELIS